MSRCWKCTRRTPPRAACTYAAAVTAAGFPTAVVQRTGQDDLSVRTARITDADFEALRVHGWTDADAWDVAAITALFALSNRMANVTAMQPNDEFFTMGR